MKRSILIVAIFLILFLYGCSESVIDSDVLSNPPWTPKSDKNAYLNESMIQKFCIDQCSDYKGLSDVFIYDLYDTFFCSCNKKTDKGHDKLFDYYSFEKISQAELDYRREKYGQSFFDNKYKDICSNKCETYAEGFEFVRVDLSYSTCFCHKNADGQHHYRDITIY